MTPVAAKPLPKSALHALLGLPAETSGTQLRLAYEAAISRASDQGNLQHAARLLQAYQAMPTERQHAIYDVVELSADERASALAEHARREAATARQTQTADAQTPQPSDMDPSWFGVPADAREITERRERRISDRMVLYCAVLFPLAVILLIAVLAGGGSSGAPAGRYTPGGTAISTPPPEQNSSTLKISPTAKTDSAGLVTVSCAATASSYTLQVKPNTTVTCANGAVPRIVS